jgi:hypothetical protein
MVSKESASIGINFGKYTGFVGSSLNKKKVRTGSSDFF